MIDSYLRSVFYENEKQIENLIKDLIITEELKEKVELYNTNLYNKNNKNEFI
jgi:hypothetical protein